MSPIRHAIEQGETVVGLSERYGLYAETIWNHADNRALRELRGNMNVLMPGDVVVIPDKRGKEVTRPTGAVHQFRRRGIPALFRLQLFEGEAPRANQRYVLDVDGRELSGVTDGDGILEQPVPAGARAGTLVIGPDRLRLAIDFGHLDPIGEIAGVQKRLNNVGYDCGEPSNTLNDRTRAALRRFQDRFGLSPTGEPDDATRAKLAELHDDPNGFPERAR